MTVRFRGVLTLLGLRGVGPQAVAQLAERFQRVAEVVEARNDGAGRGRGGCLAQK